MGEFEPEESYLVEMVLFLSLKDKEEFDGNCFLTSIFLFTGLKEEDYRVSGVRKHGTCSIRDRLPGMGVGMMGKLEIRSKSMCIMLCTYMVRSLDFMREWRH